MVTKITNPDGSITTTQDNGMSTIDRSNVISADSLQTPVNPIDLTSTIVTPQDNGIGLVTGAATSANQFQQDYQKYLDLNKTPENSQMTDLIASLGVNPLEGKGQAQLTAEQNAGLPDIQKQRADLAGQIATKTAAYTKLNADLEAGTRGFGNTDIRSSMLFGQQGAVNRQAAAEIGLLQAQDFALAGNQTAAQNAVNRAIDLQFADKEATYQSKLNQYNAIKDQLSGEEAKRGKALEYALNKEATALAEQKQTAKDIQGIAMQLASFGVDPSIIKGATTVGEALQMAGKNLQDPTQKLQIQKLKLDIQKTQQENAIFQKYGGLTPTQYMAEIEKQQKQVQAETAAQKTALEDKILLDNSISQIDAVLNSSALDSVVGSNPFSRGIARQKGFFSTALSAVTSLGLSGTGAELTGKADDTVALTQQMLDQQFLDKLIAVKGKGATFGALSDNEGQALRNAANAIAGTAIKTGSADKGNLKVIGYDMSEAEFKKQMGIIQDTMRRAREKATGEMFSSSEQDLLDTVYGADTTLTPGQYFNQ